ncbi:HDOD domain-containing protein [Janthinobacterium rivuli]|uniref:HDOD domain-containing protein n=1 Tax=Janthinobacterium rivuli TaxID=2751478 RepID=A0ABY8ICL3_9BURK|nr:HDOD domain-containing protein [Janthinobacterium rivuli]WFR82254.1 HDOD domain-containing protein [Janthinobacterium rivuli]
MGALLLPAPLPMHVNTLSSLAQLLASAETETLAFPTSINTALLLQKELANPDCHSADISRLLLCEPTLSARAVALANSALFAPGQSPAITSVRAAVERLGHRNLYALATAAVIRQLNAGIRDEALRARATQLWAHTVHVAALAHGLAGAVTHTDADTALFAGIVHEVAGFYLLAQADKTPGLYAHLETQMASALEVIGRALMRQLGVPLQVADAVNTLPGSTIMLPPEGLRDTLLLAKALAPIPSPLPQAGITISAPLQAYLENDPVLQALRTQPSAEAKGLIEVLLS